MADDRLKILEERLTRLEAALTQRAGAAGTGGFTPPGGVIVDSAPWANRQATIDPVPWSVFQRFSPPPIVDMSPWAFGGGWGRRWPMPVVDPGPFPMPVVDPAPWPSPVVDPAVFSQSLAASLGRIRPVGGDPAPPDLSRLSAQQLEASLHSISAEKARLDAMEAMVKKQIEALKKQPG